MGKSECPYAFVGNINWYNHHGELLGCSLKIKKNRFNKWYYNPTSGHIFREKHGPKGYMHPIFIEALYSSQDMEAT